MMGNSIKESKKSSKESRLEKIHGFLFKYSLPDHYIERTSRKRYSQGRKNFIIWTTKVAKVFGFLGGAIAGFKGGATVGAIIGGLIGTLFGPAGTVLGATIGFWVGGAIASPFGWKLGAQVIGGLAGYTSKQIARFASWVTNRKKFYPTYWQKYELNEVEKKQILEPMNKSSEIQTTGVIIEYTNNNVQSQNDQRLAPIEKAIKDCHRLKQEIKQALKKRKSILNFLSNWEIPYHDVIESNTATKAKQTPFRFFTDKKDLQYRNEKIVIKNALQELRIGKTKSYEILVKQSGERNQKSSI